MPTLPNAITTLPDAPVLGVDTQQTWATKAAARLTAESAMVPELNSANTTTYNNAVEAFNKATEAGNSAANALISAQSAAASSGSVLWVSGTTYALGAVVYSPINGAVYRRIVAGAGTTDPSLDAVNWQPRMLNFSTGHATTPPSLNLDFANTKRIDPRFTFARNSTKTVFDQMGVLRTVQINEPAFDHNPSTGESLGISIEKSSTNLLLRSEEFDNASWSKLNTTITANATTAPDGNNTADKLVENTATNFHYIQQGVSVTAGQYYTLSFFAKAAERSLVTVVSLAPPQAATTFNLASGSIAVAGDTDVVYSEIVNCGNGWYRCIVTHLAATTTTATYGIALANSNPIAGNLANYTGDGTSGLFIWGAQLEQSVIATSYIPTTTATATRSADLLVDTTIGDWYNPAEGTFIVEFARVVYPVGGVDTGQIAFAVSDNTSNNFIKVIAATASPNAQQSLIAVGGVNQAVMTNAGTVTSGIDTVVSIAYKLNDFATSMNGSVVTTDSAGTIPVVDRLYIGAAENGITRGSQTIKRIVYYPVRLTNEQLVAMSLN